MHSFQPSRGRVLFEFLCALGIVASSVGAWKQTGASALLLAALVAGLYGFVRLLDLRHGKPVEASEPKQVEPAPQPQPDIHAFLKAVGPEPAVEAESEVVEPVREPEPAEPVVAEVNEPKPRRKGGGRKPKIAAEPKVVELVPPEEPAVPEPEPVAATMEEPEPAAEYRELTPEEVELCEFAVSEESAPQQIAPLFEPEPFARMQRRAFGRRGRL